MIPDAEKLVGKYLRDALDVRVVSKTPDDKSTSWVKVTQLNATNDSNVTPDYLVTYLLQLDCYAGASLGQPEAIGLGGTVRELLDAVKGSVLTAGTAPIDGTIGVVTNVRFGGHARIPDGDGFEPARERIVLDALVTMHRGTVVPA